MTRDALILIIKFEMMNGPASTFPERLADAILEYLKKPTL